VLTETSNLESFGEKTWQIALGIVGVVVLVVAFLWLQAGTMAYAAEPDLCAFDRLSSLSSAGLAGHCWAW
jgi:hypothetical protein